MKIVSFWIITIALFVGLTGCSQGSEIHYDPPTTTTTNSQIKAWEQNSLPLVIYVPIEMNSYQQAIVNSEKTWNDAMGTQVFQFIFNDSSKLNTQWSKQYDSLYDSYFGLFKILSPNWNYTEINSGVLAFTGTLTTNGRIVHADVLFNFQNYSFGDANDGSYNAQFIIDFESVLTHELGHFLGLNHVTTTEDPNSVMLPKISRGAVKRQLSNGDIDRIRELYNIR